MSATPSPASPIAQAIQRRVGFASFIVFCCLLLLSGRLFWLQLVKGDHYTALAQDFRTRDVPITARRGTISDRNGSLLALSIDAHSVYANPRAIENKEETARTLSEVLGLKYAEVAEKLNTDKAFVTLARKVTPEAAEKLQELHLTGVSLEEKGQRFYPHASLASQVLGFAGSDNQGLYGLELKYEAELAGQDGQFMGEFDPSGTELPGGAQEYIPPVDGHNLILTLDETIQYTAERELAKAVQANHALRGIAIVMDTTTGGILAMASQPDFDPNTPGAADADRWRNPAIEDSYEPGSTFKSIVLSAALEEGLTYPEEHFFCPGFIKLPGRNINCISKHGDQNLTEAVENSCNVAFVTLGLRLGAERLYRYARAFSIGTKTGIPFPGEAAGVMIPLSDLRQVDLGRIAIGQAISATPLQMVNVFATIANGGVAREPHLVKEIRDADGQVVASFEPTAEQRVISPETIARVRAMLESVVTNGSGSNAYIEGYRVAGKTGTAQKVIKGQYVQGKYISSFAGFAPADNPRVAVIVIMDEPGGALHYGGQICAPVFKTIVQTSLEKLGVLPTVPILPASEPEETGKKTIVPSVRFIPTAEAKTKLRDAGLSLVVEGTGDLVFKQEPGPGKAVKPGTAVTITLGEGRSITDAVTSIVVPDLTGKTIRAAAEQLEPSGLFLQAEGAGAAVRQEPTAGTPVPAGTTIKVIFE